MVTVTISFSWFAHLTIIITIVIIIEVTASILFEMTIQEFRLFGCLQDMELKLVFVRAPRLLLYYILCTLYGELNKHLQAYTHSVLFSCRLNVTHFLFILLICQFFSHFKIGYGIVCKQQKQPLCWYFCRKWMANTVYCCVWPAFGVHIFCSLCDYCVCFLFYFCISNPFTYIYLYNNAPARAHIESCCLICVVVHVLIENNVLRIQNCTCVCECVAVWVCVFPLCLNTNQIRWAETAVIVAVAGVVVATAYAIHVRCTSCNYSKKCQQIKQKLICLLTKDHTFT